MSYFTLHLQSATNYEAVENVISFVGQDKQGKFGLMANHERFITSLEFGLARYRVNTESWSYIALPGGILHFVNNEMFISTRQYLINDDYEKICEELEKVIQNDYLKTKNIRESLHKMEQEMFKRLWEVGRLEA